MKSWRTTVLGVVTGLGIVCTQLVAMLDSDPETVFSLEVLLTGLAAMGIGYFARDNSVSSETAGAK